MSAVERQELEQFRRFFDRYYQDEIATLAQHYPTEQRSIEVAYSDVYRFDTELAQRYLTHPDELRQVAEEALRTVDLPADVSLSGANVRVFDLGGPYTFYPGQFSPTTEAGDLRTIEGEIARSTKTYPRLVEAAFECQRCGTMAYIPQSGADYQEPHECQGCERQGPFRINHDQSEFIDAQKLELRCPPEVARGAGESIEVVLEDDLCGRAKAGDRVAVTGQVHVRQKGSGQQKRNRFETYIDAHHVAIEDQDHRDLDIDQETRERVERLASGDEGDPLDLAADSLATEIYGHEEMKKAAVLALVGGQHVEPEASKPLRGKIHVLILGDPGTGKSRLIDQVADIGFRTLSVSGKAATTSGLTAAAVQDEFSGESGWTLDAGAMVMANRGAVAIDELDDMDADVRSSLLEPMSKQRVSVSKAGINATLETRTSVIAAGNPKQGRFDPYQRVDEQFPFEANLTSRFDLIYTVSDEPVPDEDREIADHILSHRDAAKRAMRNDLEVSERDRELVEPAVDRETLRAWIAIARQQPAPTFPADGSVKEQLLDQFTDLRGAYNYNEDSPVPVTFREQEAVIRLAEAAARFELSNVIRERHARIAIDMVHQSLMDYYRDEEGNLDADVVETGTSTSQRDRHKYLQALVTTMADREEYEDGRVPIADMIAEVDNRAADGDEMALSITAEQVRSAVSRWVRDTIALTDGPEEEKRVYLFDPEVTCDPEEV